MFIEVNSEKEMTLFGQFIGSILHGGETIELVGDVGAGKTTFTKGLALGLGVLERVASPSFTISRVYDAHDNLTLSHYDFYRLNDAGIMANEIQESINDQNNITVIEWSGIVEDILPKDRLTIKITASSEDSRKLNLSGSEDLIKLIQEHSA